ncbi:MAG: hypothetical protein WC375_09695 [Methanomassiliicoccales archaeon]|jgi:hypothetical protein
MYCTVEDMRNLLPEKITIGDQNIGTPSPGRPQTLRDSLTPELAQTYIDYAQQFVDARLRPFYVCPLRRIKSFEVDVTVDIIRGQHVNVVLYNASPIVRGNIVRLQSKTEMETCTVEATIDDNTIRLASVVNNYQFSETTLSTVEFPDPIPTVAARFAVSFMIDRLFVAEQSPDISNYSKTQRNLARDSLQDILTGQAFLFGQEITGRRFVRGTLLDAYNSPSKQQEKGEDKES